VRLTDCATLQVVFHKGQAAVGRPIAVRIAAGAAHSSCVTQVRFHIGGDAGCAAASYKSKQLYLGSTLLL